MLQIDWRPSPDVLRRWSFGILPATLVAGLLLRVFTDHDLQATILWTFGGLAFLLGISGCRLALPLYLLWMALVWVVSRSVGALALGIVFLLVVTPIGIFARFFARDRLALRRPRSGSLWLHASPTSPERFDRPF